MKPSRRLLAGHTVSNPMMNKHQHLQKMMSRMSADQQQTMMSRYTPPHSI
mgnify:CR=1 FL=1